MMCHGKWSFIKCQYLECTFTQWMLFKYWTARAFGGPTRFSLCMLNKGTHRIARAPFANLKTMECVLKMLLVCTTFCFVFDPHSAVLRNDSWLCIQASLLWELRATYGVPGSEPKGSPACCTISLVSWIVFAMTTDSFLVFRLHSVSARPLMEPFRCFCFVKFMSLCNSQSSLICHLGLLPRSRCIYLTICLPCI